MQTTIPETDKYKLTLVIEGREIIVDSAKFIPTMDTCANYLQVLTPWTPGEDEKLDEIIAPYSYSKCQLYIGSDLQMSGVLYDVTHKQDGNGMSKELEIWTQTADLIDSTVYAPFEERDISLTQRCRNQCKPFGIQVVIGDGVNLTRKIKTKTDIKREFIGPVQPRWLFRNLSSLADYYLMPREKETYKYKIITEEQKFSRVTAQQTDKIFDHLKKLAGQRGVLISCTKFGDLLITKANLTDPPVGTIEDGGALANSYTAKFSGRKRYAIYRALTHSAKHVTPVLSAVVKDEDIKSPRILSFQAKDSLSGEGKNAAEWAKRKAAADSMTFPLPVNDWYAPNGKLWEPNTTVTVKSKIIDPNGFTFLIRNVEFNYQNDGMPATLSLIPPFAYTLED